MKEDLHNYIGRAISDQNSREIPDFEGYSPNEMESILYEPFSKNSPIQWMPLTPSEYRSIPILNQIKYLAGLIEAQGEMKLTNRGYLLTKFVADIYRQEFLKEPFIEAGILKLVKESDSRTINLTRILLEMSRLVKKRHNKLSLTRAGKNTIHDDRKLLTLILMTFCTKFNWAYYDGFSQEIIGRFGFVFSLILFSKYGNEKHNVNFYADKYFKAFPKLLDLIPVRSYRTVKTEASLCYSLRTFERFLEYFGLVEIESEEKIDSHKYVTKTKLYDRLIRCEAHRNL